MASIMEFLFLWTFFQNMNTQGQLLKTERATMDNTQICHDRGTTTKFVRDKASHLLLAKSGPNTSSTVKHCEVILGPANNDMSLVVTFQSFYTLQDSCSVRLTITESKDSTMKDEKTVLQLNYENGRNKKPQDLGFVTGRNAFLKFSVVHDLNHTLYYFNINVTAVPVRADSNSDEMLSEVKIGVMIISVVAIMASGYLIYKTVRMKMSKWAFNAKENSAALHNMSNIIHSNRNAYVHMPPNEQVLQYVLQNTDPEICFEYNSSQSHFLQNGLTEKTTQPLLSEL